MKRTHSHRLLLLLIGIACLINARTGWADPALSADESPQIQPPVPYSYLEAVRAQRQALVEQRRRDAQEAVNARRKYLDPWGEAQREARQNELQQRRRSLDEMAEQHREQVEQMRRERTRDIYPYTPDYYGWGNPWALPAEPGFIP